MFESIHGAGSAAEFARRIGESAKQFYGSPLRAYIESLAMDLPGAQEVLRAHVADYLHRNVPAGSTGEIARAGMRFAVIAAAGELATSLGLTGWGAGEPTAATERCFQNWIKTRETTGSSDIERAVRQVRTFLGTNGGSRFQSLHGAAGDVVAERIQNRAGFKRTNDDGETEYLVLPEILKAEVCVGHSYRAVLKEIDRLGWLRRQAPELTIRVRLPEMGMARVFCINEAILEGVECTDD